MRERNLAGLDCQMYRVVVLHGVPRMLHLTASFTAASKASPTSVAATNATHPAAFRAATAAAFYHTAATATSSAYSC